MNSPFLSIITPTHNRVLDGKLQRCLNSVRCQVSPDFEHIIVDDGGNQNVAELVNEVTWDWSLGLPDGRFKVIRIEHGGRVIARNAGMAAAQGQWITWLDDDDALDPMYTATYKYYADLEPDVRLWVGGVVVHGMVKDASGQHICPKWTRLRQAWMPPVNTDGNHEIFPSGHVGTGMLVFHRSCLEKTGLMPPWLNHNQIADGIDEFLGVPPGTTGYSSAKRLVGNPFGDDHAMFQKLCLFYQVHTIEACLYVQFVR